MVDKATGARGMEKSDWKKLLNNSSLFGRLTEAETKYLLEESRQENFPRGETILREGERSEYVYIIGSGHVSVALSGATTNKVPIESLTEGNFFGEMACMEHKPRMASVIADSDCELLQIPAAAFQHLTEENARFSSRLGLILSDRLRKLTEEILAVRVKNVDEKLELSNTKLDASLKAMDSQMKAAETIFEQTSSRASEVIQSFDRTRSQVILAGTIVSVFASMVVGILVFLGWKEWKDITRPVQEQIAEISAISEGLDDKSRQIDEILRRLEPQLAEAEQMSARLAELKEVRLLLREADRARMTLYSIIIKSSFDRIALEHRHDLFGAILDAADSNLTEEIYLNFPQGLINPRAEYRQQYFDLLEATLADLKRNAREGDTVKTKQTALTYYYLIAGRLLEGNEQRYISLRNEFDDFIATVDIAIPVIRDLGPIWFAEYLDAIDMEGASLKVSRLTEVWENIRRSRS